jgi:hypothetical protein
VEERAVAAKLLGMFAPFSAAQRENLEVLLIDRRQLACPVVLPHRRMLPSADFS